ncbi:hypothetical protein [Curtobacterium sp. MCLR17_054]|uniref:hypothetical protein n=1 Tax=Curtobacterium sp. MCLR17_054 TaxID=2175632 RepID=UPI000DA7FA11|nr:hypothetical protein [Curtobacterium sp. MCLR17_054]WIE69208.1 hypothetical protein DEJ08_004320 [Curtobacterium sp. MCLR17_054]
MTDRDDAAILDDRLADSSSNWEHSWLRLEAIEAGGSPNRWQHLISALVWALGGKDLAYVHSRVEVLGDSGLIEIHLFTSTTLVRVKISHEHPDPVPEVVALDTLEAIRVVRAPSVFSDGRGMVSKRARLELTFAHGDVVTIDNEQTYTTNAEHLLDYYPTLLKHLAKS